MVEVSGEFFDEVTFFVEVNFPSPKATMSLIDHQNSDTLIRHFRAQENGFWLSFADSSDLTNSQSDRSRKERVSFGSIRSTFGSSVPELRTFFESAESDVFALISYDLKNQLENLQSGNEKHFDIPEFLLMEAETEVVDSDILNDLSEESMAVGPIDLIPSLTRKEYVAKIKSIKQHIQLGDVYELNFCFEHVAEGVDLDPFALFAALRSSDPNPFGAYVKFGHLHCICNSPERFMARSGSRLYSQPMKGTNNSDPDPELNLSLKHALMADPKERSENVMITDLVRNDLSKYAKPGSVKVDELCGVYTLGSVNQMVSTVSCELKEGMHPIDAVLGAFPMGSMTGAPKHRAMQLIDRYEDFARGIFSGSIGYFKPDGDFDLNVVIRSLIYDDRTKRLSLPTGSAITIHSDPDKEYDECMLKAQRIKEILNGG